MHGTRLRRRAQGAILCLALLAAPAWAEKAQGQGSSSAASPKTASQPKPRVYVVRKGDVLVNIAKRFHVSVRDLVRANGIKHSDRIREGQVLRLPDRRAARGKTDPKDANKPNDALVHTALKYRGVPYRYAGMSSRGMDCSGLVARVLKVHGVKAPHNSAALYRLGVPVPAGKLLPGDLVFFHTTRRGISHVGIYTGDGKFVHASSGGGHVQVDRMDQGYYHQRFVGARRIS